LRTKAIALAPCSAALCRRLASRLKKRDYPRQFMTPSNPAARDLE
jgi:hypothetical protein